MPDYLNDRLESELIVGLVSEVGTETKRAIDRLKDCLGSAGYAVLTVKISQDVIPLLVDVPPHGNDQYKRISDLMDAGNKAREDKNDDAILALGTAAIVFANREKGENGTAKALPKTAIIVDSLKRPEEVETLRRIYPLGFVLIGVHEQEHRRLNHLTGKGMTLDNAKRLVERDREESKIDHGQRVNRTFHLADFFVQLWDNHDRLQADIKRMVDLWFGQPFITPTFDEHAMFMAFAAGLRSADLSRQVGAVVTRDHQILATGANDCPKAGGGLYWATPQKDGSIADDEEGRDYKRPDGDSNRAEQNRIIERIVSDGASDGLDSEKLRKLLQKSQIRDLTEYGRVVHAEMEALLSCVRCGTSVVGAALYCTTFPCHNCAKHIIAAGVKRVVYVEPYPKSKTWEFHNDAIAAEDAGQKEKEELVVFEPFVGIGPRRFFDLFSMHLGSTYPLVRKNSDTGKPVDWRIEKSQLRIQMRPVSYLELEAQACARFERISNPQQVQKAPL